MHLPRHEPHSCLCLNDEPHPGEILPLVIAFWFRVAWVVWWAVAPLLQARRQAEAVLSEPPVRFVFSPAGVEMIRLDVSMQIAWPGIRRVKETWFSFLIYPRQSSPLRRRPGRPLDSSAPVDETLFCASPPLLRGHRGFTSLPHLDSQSSPGEIKLGI